MNSLRMIGGAVGLLVGIGVAVWLGIVLAAAWSGIVFWAVVLGTVGARIGSLTRPSIWEHKLLMQIGPVLGAMAGVFLGIYLVHGFPPKGDFGLPVIAGSAALAFLGFVLPLVVLSRLVPVRCPRCSGPAYFGTDSTFFRQVPVLRSHRGRDFSQPVSRDG